MLKVVVGVAVGFVAAVGLQFAGVDIVSLGEKGKQYAEKMTYDQCEARFQERSQCFDYRTDKQCNELLEVACGEDPSPAKKQAQKQDENEEGFFKKFLAENDGRESAQNIN